VIQNLLPLFPRRIGATGLAVAIGSSAIGCGLWLVGARFSRPLLALAATIGGGAIGFQSPHWFGWTMDPWTVAVLGALVLGIFGLMAHRWLAVAGLGIVIAAWAILFAVSHYVMPKQFLAPLLPTELIWAQLLNFPKSLSDEVVQLFLVIGGAGLVGGVVIGWRWPRLGVVLFWALLGMILSLIPALAAAQAVEPRYLDLIPAHPQAQALTLAALVLVGTTVQWRMTFSKRPRQSANSA
jgi:hypothetical protein